MQELSYSSRFRKGSREGLGGFGTKSGQVQQDFGKSLVPEKIVKKKWEVWV